MDCAQVFHRLNTRILKAGFTGSIPVPRRVYGRSQMNRKLHMRCVTSLSHVDLVGLDLGLQRALEQTKWEEYSSNGQRYYYNTETKESKWDMPDELLLLLEQVEENKPGAQVATVAATNIQAKPNTPTGGANQGLSLSLARLEFTLTTALHLQGFIRFYVC
ncbi:hypothetical protein AX16_010198 [Volvariella volvacea WC 439]|nr:hypothetical protein AX16_010198 [Volvariella volvacea WC 439]